MQMTTFGIPFREDIDASCFGRLARLLETIHVEISKESARLTASAERISDCAAFCFEAMENGDNHQRMSSKIDVFSRSLAFNRSRQAFLSRQMAFIERTLVELADAFSSSGP